VNPEYDEDKANGGNSNANGTASVIPEWMTTSYLLRGTAPEMVLGTDQQNGTKKPIDLDFVWLLLTG
jgi:hypothetical protein